MTHDEVQSGLEGVVAFATEIAEPDKAGGALRYRGVDIEDLVGQVRFENVWGLLVDGSFEPGLPPAEPHPLAVTLRRPGIYRLICTKPGHVARGMRATIRVKR